jgi:1-acyl-sn-glycerol-3-phosphate acyltransferase
MRRAISIPLMYIVLFLMLCLYPLLLPVLGVMDIVRKNGWSGLRLAAFAFWYIYLECAGIILATCSWLFYLGGSRRPDRYLQANYAIQSWWLNHLGFNSFRIYNDPLVVEGGELPAGGSTLLFLRHSSTMDTVLGGMFGTVRHKVRYRYVFKKELLWDPCLDIMGNRLQNYFVNRSSNNIQQEIENIGRLAHDLGENEGVLMYPEGTRFTEKKRLRILEKLKAAGDQQGLARAESLKNLLPPRLGGTLELLKQNTHADVVFCAHVGLEKASSFTELINGELFNRTVYVKFWRTPFSEIPTEREEQIDWLFEQWQKMDDYIGDTLNKERAD